MSIFGMDVDFVNLRADEIYSEDSRIPLSTNRFGTPLQDAMRRDFTVNSLFYNLHTREVEDHTNQGLTHLLVDKIIQTPIDPNITFYDDPLRVLRAIRFAVRYDFQLHHDLMNAAKSEPIRKALQQKVSRERVGKELEGMLTGKRANPYKALDLIAELDLSRSVFSFPDNSNSTTQFTVSPELLPDMLTAKWKESKSFLAILHKILPTFQRMLCTDQDSQDVEKNSSKIDERMLYLSTFLLPFFSTVVKDKKGKEQPLAQWMLREGIKFKNSDISAIGNHINNLLDMQSLLHKHIDQFDESTRNINLSTNPKLMPSRLEAGLILRKLKDGWLTNLILATIVEAHFLYQNVCNSNQVSLNEIDENQRLKEIVGASYDLHQRILVLNLEECWKIKPLVDGKNVAQILSLPRGPLVGLYLEEQVRYTLLFPNATKDQCENHLLKVRKKRQVDGLDNDAVKKIAHNK